MYLTFPFNFFPIHGEFLDLETIISFVYVYSSLGSKIVKSGEDGVKVKIPADQIKEGRQLTFTLNVAGSYKKYTGYYYYHSSKYQKMLFQDPLETMVPLNDSFQMTVKHPNEKYDINIKFFLEVFSSHWNTVTNNCNFF